MSCINCKLHKSNFKTEKEFREFDNLLQQLIKDGKIICLGEKKGSRFFSIRYQCQCCNAIWILSIPDQSFRGGWCEQQ
jgi:hypothetical protein